MADMMLFPKTWEEFEKQYGFYDSKQAYMYGNTRLIPSFRVQQWLDHIGDIKRKKQSQMNKMKQVAAIFGKQLGERFSVKVNNQIYDCSFKEYGFDSYGAYNNPYLDFDAFILQELLTGTAEIVNGEND